MTEITFNAQDHTYWRGPERIPSVSEILRPLTDSYLAGIPEAILNRKRDIGIAVHRACELVDQGYDLDPDTIDPDVNGYLEGYRRFLVDMKPQWTQIETMVFDPVRWYAGRLDRVGIISGVPTVVDLKTSVQLGGAVAIQLTAYAEAGADELHALAALQLLPKGEYKLVPLPRESHVWDALVTVHQFKERTK